SLPVLIARENKLRRHQLEVVILVRRYATPLDFPASFLQPQNVPVDLARRDLQFLSQRRRRLLAGGDQKQQAADQGRRSFPSSTVAGHGSLQKAMLRDKVYSKPLLKSMVDLTDRRKP